jgi:large subunit ribosomal protein L5e
MPLGLTNYAACYATGLLLARRWLKKINLDTKYEGLTDVQGQDYHVEPLRRGPRPFKALLDVGLRRTTTGSRVFAALKGAVDGGMNVPHSETRFVGYDAEEGKLNSEVLRKHIFGGHVADWMKQLKTDDFEGYKRHFSKYIEAKINPEDIEKKWTTVHAAIRKSPDAVKSTKSAELSKNKKFQRMAKRTLANRKNRVAQLIAAKAKSQKA